MGSTTGDVLRTQGRRESRERWLEVDTNTAHNQHGEETYSKDAIADDFVFALIGSV